MRGLYLLTIGFYAKNKNILRPRLLEIADIYNLFSIKVTGISNKSKQIKNKTNEVRKMYTYPLGFTIDDRLKLLGASKYKANDSLANKKNKVIKLKNKFRG